MLPSPTCKNIKDEWVNTDFKHVELTPSSARDGGWGQEKNKIIARGSKRFHPSAPLASFPFASQPYQACREAGRMRPSSALYNYPGVRSVDHAFTHQLYQTRLYEWVQTFMMYDHGVLRARDTAFGPIAGLQTDVGAASARVATIMR